MVQCLELLGYCTRHQVSLYSSDIREDFVTPQTSVGEWRFLSLLSDSFRLKDLGVGGGGGVVLHHKNFGRVGRSI